MLNIVMLNVVMLSVVMLNVVMLNVVAPEIIPDTDDRIPKRVQYWDVTTGRESAVNSTYPG
jgi:hypothetical protein